MIIGGWQRIGIILATFYVAAGVGVIYSEFPSGLTASEYLVGEDVENGWRIPYDEVTYELVDGRWIEIDSTAIPPDAFECEALLPNGEWSPRICSDDGSFVKLPRPLSPAETETLRTKQKDYLQTSLILWIGPIFLVLLIIGCFRWVIAGFRANKHSN